MAYQTRSQRHLETKQKRRKHARVFTSIVGTGLLAGPTALAIFPQQSSAEEYQFSNTPAESLIAQIGGTAQEIAASNDLYASVMIAQALLESGNGQSLLSSAPNYNLFGVKAYGEEAKVWLATQEYLNNQWVTMNEPFRVYGSYWESLQDHAAVLKSDNYTTGTPNYVGAWKSQTSSYYDATAYLTGRYATDPNYAQKLNTLIEIYGLTRFDTPSQSNGYTYTSTEYEPQNGEQTVEELSYQEESNSTYTVVAGDTLWDIAQRQGISLEDLMANNGLTDDLITVGQQLVI